MHGDVVDGGREVAPCVAARGCEEDNIVKVKGRVGRRMEEGGYLDEEGCLAESDMFGQRYAWDGLTRRNADERLKTDDTLLRGCWIVWWSLGGCRM